MCRYGHGVKTGRKPGVPQPERRIPFKPCRKCGTLIPRPETGWVNGRHGYKLCAECGAVAGKGPNHPKWKGGRAEMTYDGYVRLYHGPGRRVYEHRYVWEQARGPIPPGYHVHHRNGIKTDNRLENLELLFGHTHLDQHAKALTREVQWSRDRLACIDCRSTEHPHRARGLCTVCYNRVAPALKCPRPCCQ